MKISLKGKSIIKKVALALAGVAAISAVGFGVKAIVDYTKDDLKKITLSYDVGNLGADGKYVADEGTMYTKEAFACYGLQVKPDFDSTVNYQIFYYDILDNYISSTEVMSDGYSDNAPLHGAYARIVIEPKNDEDGKISLIEKVKYSSQLSVKVYKEQNVNERYGVYKGRILDVVSDTKDLVFEAGIQIFNFEWRDNAQWASTSLTVLKVNSGSTLNIDFTALGEENAKKIYCHVYEFSGLPLNDNLIIPDSGMIVSNSVAALNKNTRYVLLCVDYTNLSGFTWSDANIAKLPSCFSVTKTK